MSVRTYDAKDVSIILGGVPITGYADGTFVSVERDEDAFTKVVGADGDTSRARSNHNGGMVTITLMQTSPSNKVLEDLATLDELTNAGIVPIMVKDNSGLSLYSSDTAWIKKRATSNFGKEIDNREWIVDVADLIMLNAGNALFA